MNLVEKLRNPNIWLPGNVIEREQQDLEVIQP
jgi:hypothetical protein